MINLDSVQQFLKALQQDICTMLEQEDGLATFKEDAWTLPNGGGGRSRVLQDGKHIEQAGVNFSHVCGASLPTAAMAHRSHLAGHPFEAMGVSVVIHPKNPFIPTSHMNVRVFVAKPAGKPPEWWFGGGFDLTPYYGFDEDCVAWHQAAKECCDPFGDTVYPRYKQWCDAYFYLPHRKEARGIGGIFFDDLNEWPFDDCFAFMQLVGKAYLSAYQQIMAKRKVLSYTEKHQDFQRYRRGRYVEFNLLYDRGTLFGLKFGGRIESILMSLPPVVNFVYNYQPMAGTEEAKLYTDYLPPRDWLSDHVFQDATSPPPS